MANGKSGQRAFYEMKKFHKTHDHNDASSHKGHFMKMKKFHKTHEG